MSASQYKIVLQDGNGVELSSRTLTQVETIKIKHIFAGDAGVASEVNNLINRMLSQSGGQFLSDAISQCNALGITPTDFTNGVEFAIMKAWYSNPAYKDAEARGI